MCARVWCVRVCCVCVCVVWVGGVRETTMVQKIDGTPPPTFALVSKV